MIKKDYIRIYKNTDYEIYYAFNNKTVYIYPPINVLQFMILTKSIKANYDVDNIVVGRLYDNY